MMLQSSSIRLGKITFGNYDIEKFAKKGLTTSDMFWASLIDSPYYWTVGLDDVSMGGESVKAGANGLIFDSGTSLSLIPTEALQLILDLLSSNGVDMEPI